VACQKLHTSALIPQVPPIATTPSKHLPPYYFARPAEVVAPELIGCLLVKRQATGAVIRLSIQLDTLSSFLF